MLQVMSDLCMYNFANTGWDDPCLSEDHIVPHTGCKRLDDHFILGDNHKKPRRELASITGGISTARYGESPTMINRRNTMSEKGLLSNRQNDGLGSVSDSPTNEASNVASDNTMPSMHAFNNNDLNGSESCAHDTILGDKMAMVDNSFSYPLNEMNQVSNDLDFFRNGENKDSSDFLYYGWPEIGNFEDIDNMFRSCDSTFGLSACKEDELGWLSADNLRGSEDVTNVMENLSDDNDLSKCYSITESVVTSAPTRYNEGSWTTEKSDSYMSMSEPDTTDSKGTRIQQLQPRISTSSHCRTGSIAMVDEQKKQSKLQNQYDGISKECYLENGTLSGISSLTNKVMHQPSGLTSHQAFPSLPKQRPQQSSCLDSYSCLPNILSYVHSDNGHLSDPTLAIQQGSVKSEINDFTSPSPRESSHASSQFQHMDSDLGPHFELNAAAVCEQREKKHSCQGSRSSVNSSRKNGTVVVEANIFDPGLVGKSENHVLPERVLLATPEELDSSNVHEGRTLISGLEDISLEAASFCQLQLVMERLDSRTKLCIRDSLYRLARSAELRHNHANQNVGCGDAAGVPSAAEGTTRCTSFVDMETDTNPIDRSIAHLLFHRPPESSSKPGQDSFHLKLPTVANGSVESPPLSVENLVDEETVSEVDKGP